MSGSVSSFTNSLHTHLPCWGRWESPVDPEGINLAGCPDHQTNITERWFAVPHTWQRLCSQLHSNTHRNLQEVDAALPSRQRFIFEYDIRKQAGRRRTRCALGGTLQSLNKDHLFLMMQRHTDRNWTSVNYWTSRDTETSKCLEQIREPLRSSRGKNTSVNFATAATRCAHGSDGHDLGHV